MATTDVVTFGAILKRYRLAADLTQEQLAERARVSWRTISDLERGETRWPYRDTVALLEEALRLTDAERATFEALARRRARRSPGTAPPAIPSPPVLGSATPALPTPLTPLLGREAEMAAVCGCVQRADTRLVTLTGPAGVGKTRLGLEVAAALREGYADGVVFVALASIGDPALVVPTIAQTLGLRDAGAQPLIESVAGFLRPKRVLLLLDNFEQVVQSAAVVTALLIACPQLTILVTSRAALRVRGEREIHVPPLALPDPARPSSLDTLASNPAVTLFVQQAQAAKPDFCLSSTTGPVVAAICARLDGLPLAIELAAAWIKALPAPALLARLEHRLQVLHHGPRDLPLRQQTLRDAIAWSDDLLDPAERTLFRQCAVFVGGWTLAAAEAVCATPMSPAGQKGDVLYGLMSLVDKSLVLQDELPTGEPRFRMLETIREYALERLVADGMADEMRRRHAAYFRAFLEQVNPALTRPEDGWLSQVDQDYDNLRAVLAWARATGHLADGVCLAGALWPYWCIRSVREGRTWLDQFARADLSVGDIDDSHLARALLGAGVLATRHDDYDQGRRRLEESLALYRALGDTAAIADCLRKLGNVAVDDGGQFGRADDLYGESLALYRKLREESRSTAEADAARAIDVGVAACLNNQGVVARKQGHYERAAHLVEEGVAIFRAMQNTSNLAQSLTNLGIIETAQGNLIRAETLLQESLTLHRAVGSVLGEAEALACLARVERCRGDDGRSLTHYAQSLEMYYRADQPLGEIALCLEGCAGIASAHGQPALAARLLGKASALRATVNMPLPPDERAVHEQDVMATRAVLGPATFAEQWAVGAQMALEETADTALRLRVADPGTAPNQSALEVVG